MNNLRWLNFGELCQILKFKISWAQGLKSARFSFTIINDLSSSSQCSYSKHIQPASLCLLYRSAEAVVACRWPGCRAWSPIISRPCLILHFKSVLLDRRPPSWHGSDLVRPSDLLRENQSLRRNKIRNIARPQDRIRIYWYQNSCVCFWGKLVPHKSRAGCISHLHRYGLLRNGPSSRWY